MERRSSLSYISEEDSDDEENGHLKRRQDNDGNEEPTKKRKIELVGSMPRLSNASNLSSSLGSSSSSEGEMSPTSFSMKENLLERNSLPADMVGTKENSAQSSFSIKAQKMMMKMGYEKGKGLGKFQQGIVAPIATSKQRGKRGLGFIIQGLEPMENLKWDKSKEHISVQEEVFWLPPNTPDLPDLQTMLSWVKEGPKNIDISGETHFCHPNVLQQVMLSKSVFDELPEKELMKARSRSNPFETLGKLFFQNRAALKMANMDTVFDFMFTRPVDEHGKSLVGPEELLYFADVCAAPGGFSEYVLWRRKICSDGFCDAKGFGFTLKENDFKLHDFFAAPSEYFEPHYGVNGLNGDGDIYVPSNISNFRDFVLKSTGGNGVHFMMADGGFSVEGQENIQEILSKRLYLCQFLVALGIVRKDGHFVCKVFDIFTPFSVGLVYIMYKSFKQVSIHKPNTSRPANSERYLICKWRKADVSDAFEYFYKINSRLEEFGSSSKIDITEVVPLEVLKEDEEFYNYICDSNNVFGERQVIGLQKIQAFCRDPSLFEDQQATLRRECLTFWQMPDRTRVAPERKDPKNKATELLSTKLLEQLSQGPVDLNPENLIEKVRSPYDYRFVFLASSKDGVRERGFFLCLGGNNIYLWNGGSRKNWCRMDIVINIPSDTIFYGEVVTELRGELRGQRKCQSIHCIDALVLNGFDVTKMHLVERHGYLKKFATAVNKESRNDFITIRCKPLYKLEEIENMMKPPLIDWRVMKGRSSMQRRVYREAEAFESDPIRYTIPTGIMMIKITQDPWMMAYSKGQKKKYWYNTQSRASTFECFKEAIAPISISYCNGMFWWWNPGVQILETEEKKLNELHLETLVNHINNSR